METEVLETDIRNTTDARMALRPSSCTLGRIVELEWSWSEPQTTAEPPPPSSFFTGSKESHLFFDFLSVAHSTFTKCLLLTQVCLYMKYWTNFLMNK